MDDILFSIVQCVFIIVAGIITRYIIPWLKSKLDTEKFNTLELWVKAAVSAAEQILCKDCSGPEKKAYVTDIMEKYLNTKGVKITQEQLNILIESAVKEMNISIKKDSKINTPKKSKTDYDNSASDDEDTDI